MSVNVSKVENIHRTPFQYDLLPVLLYRNDVADGIEFDKNCVRISWGVSSNGIGA
jgi:hypothetical protein